MSVKSPFPFEALPRVWAWIQGFRHKVADDFSPASLSAFVRLEAQKWPHQKTWAIYGDGELGGLVTYEKENEWVGTAHLLLKPDFQGKGLAVKALRRAFAEMFGTGIGRLVFYVLSGNLAVGSLVVNLGGRREGCLRNHTLQNGVPTDVWIYGLMKEEFRGGEKHELSVRLDQDDQQQHDAHVDGAGAVALQPAE